MTAGRHRGIALVSIAIGCLLAFLLAGFQRHPVIFFAIGIVSLLGSSACFLLWFRRLFDLPDGGKWLNAALIILCVHAIFLSGEGALRAVEQWKWRSLTARESFIVNEYLPAWRTPEIARLHKADPELCLRLVPNSTAKFLGSTIRINSHGTRGREFPLEKAPNELRVLALGASTTWGATVKPDDRPYPEVLEGILARQLGRPVTVINAGIAGLPVQCTAKRLERELLQFNPDYVVFYEGFANIPSGISGEFRFRARGSLLIQQAMLLHAELPVGQTPYLAALQETYRAGVQRIAELCEARGIQLFLCTFALAYDESTPAEYLDFYQRIMPLYGGQTALSALNYVRENNKIVREIAEAHHLPLIDIAAILGGRHEYFLDFCHFQQPGRDLLAQEIAKSMLSWASRIPDRTPSEAITRE